MPPVVQTSAVLDLQVKLGLDGADGLQPPPKPWLIASADAEKYGWGGQSPVTEIGFAVLDTRRLQNLPPNASNLDILLAIDCYHYRPKESAFLKNGKNWSGNNFDKAEFFDYGISEFVHRTQVQSAVMQILDVGIPVHMIVQGKLADLSDTSKFAKPPFDLLNHPCLTVKQDLQEVTPTALPQLPRVGLDAVVAHLELIFPNQHNAGNDAMAQLVSAVLIAIMDQRARIGPVTADIPPKEIFQALKRNAQSRLLNPIVGVFEFCFRCGRDGHVANRACTIHVGACRRCLAWNQHRTEFCFWSPGDMLEQRRKTNYDRTKAYNDRLGRQTAPYVSYVDANLTSADHILELEVSNLAPQVNQGLSQVQHQSIPLQPILQAQVDA